MLEAGHMVAGKYRLIRQIGEGPMSGLWSAKRLDWEVAIKVTCSKDPLDHARLFREAEICAGIDALGTACILDVGTKDGCAFIVMDALNGESLAARLQREGRLPSTTILPIIWDVSLTLAQIHTKGILHCDLQPANLFLHHPPTGRLIVKILNFEHAKSGNPAEFDPRNDIYALGAVLYQAISGRLPFEQKGPSELANAIATAAPPPLRKVATDVPERVAELVAHCMTPSPKKRPPSASALAERIEAIFASLMAPQQ
jgi:serine/threonine-protein kinase